MTVPVLTCFKLVVFFSVVVWRWPVFYPHPSGCIELYTSTPWVAA